MLRSSPRKFVTLLVLLVVVFGALPQALGTENSQVSLKDQAIKDIEDFSASLLNFFAKHQGSAPSANSDSPSLPFGITDCLKEMIETFKDIEKLKSDINDALQGNRIIEESVNKHIEDIKTAENLEREKVAKKVYEKFNSSGEWIGSMLFSNHAYKKEVDSLRTSKATLESDLAKLNQQKHYDKLAGGVLVGVGVSGVVVGAVKYLPVLFRRRTEVAGLPLVPAVEEAKVQVDEVVSKVVEGAAAVVEPVVESVENVVEAPSALDAAESKIASVVVTPGEKTESGSSFLVLAAIVLVVVVAGLIGATLCFRGASPKKGASGPSTSMTVNERSNSTV